MLWVFAAGSDVPHPGATVGLVVVAGDSGGGVLHDLIGIVPSKAVAITGAGGSRTGSHPRIVVKCQPLAVARLADQMVKVAARGCTARRHQGVARSPWVAAATVRRAAVTVRYLVLEQRGQWLKMNRWSGCGECATAGSGSSSYRAAPRIWAVHREARSICTDQLPHSLDGEIRPTSPIRPQPPDRIPTDLSVARVHQLPR